MVFKKGNMIVLQNNNKEEICLYPEFLITSLSFASKARKDISISINKSDKKNYLYFKKFMEEIRNYDLYNKVSFDSDVEIDGKYNKLLIQEIEDEIIIKLIYNTKGNFNCVKIMSPYFDGKTSSDLYMSLFNLYDNIKRQKMIMDKPKIKTKKY